MNEGGTPREQAFASDDPPVGRGRRLSPEERRAQILDVALRLFGARGYADVSVGDVAEVAEIARPLVHHYFGSKEDLYIEVLSTITSRATQNLRTAEDMPLEELVPHNWDALLEFFESNAAYVRGILMLDGPVKRTSAVMDAFVEDLIDRMIRNRFGTVDVPPGVRLTMRSYAGMVTWAVREWLVFERAERSQIQTLLVESQWAVMREVAPKMLGVSEEPIDPAQSDS